MDYAREHFVTLAANDVDYKEHKDTHVFEHQLLSRMFGGANNIQQGIYMVTSSGQFLGRANLGWPDPDPVASLAALKESVAKYEGLSKGLRIQSKRLNPATDKLKFEQDQFTRPEGLLDLRALSRGYAYEGMSTFDERHPIYYGLDRLWYKPSEYMAWIPASRQVGAKVNVTGVLKDRIVLRSHQHKASMAWWEEHIKKSSMTSTITKIEGSVISIRIDAHYEMKADSQWNKGAYTGDLLGYADFDTTKNEFTKFEIVMYGLHDMGTHLDNARAGDLKQMVGAYISLNPQTGDADNLMIPSEWKYGYGLAWCRRP